MFSMVSINLARSWILGAVMMKHFIPLRLRYGPHEVAKKHCIYFAARIEVAAEIKVKYRRAVPLYLYHQ